MSSLIYFLHSNFCYLLITLLISGIFLWCLINTLSGSDPRYLSQSKMTLLSFVSIYNNYLRRCFTRAGLSSQIIDVDQDTTVHFWGPKIKEPQKSSVVLIHGFGPDAIWQWRRQVQSLTQKFNVYVPDLIFFGRSITKSEERSEKFQAVSLGKLFDKLELKRFHVVGTSYGGMVAYNLANMLGEERVGKVVIASSGVNMTKSNNVNLVERAQLDKIDDLMLPATPQNLRKLMSMTFYKPPSLPDFLLRDFLRQLYADNKEEKTELLKGLTIGRDDSSNILPLQQEVLLVWGKDDQLFPLEMAHNLKEVISKNAKLEVMEKASHVPQIEKPEEFNKIVLNFLQATS